MNFRILGPVEVLDNGGVSLTLGKRMERALLALLVLRANTPVSADACIDALWPTDPPASAEASLYSLVARLRRRLEPNRPAGDPPTRLVRDPAGYRLVTNHDEIDVRRFRQLAGRGRTLLDAGDAAGARQHLSAALAEWQGPALGEFAYDAFADRSAEQLENLRIEVTEDELGARLALDEPNLVPELEAFVVDHPLREYGWSYLLVALYRSGRQTEALRRAEDLRVTLAEVGLDPSPHSRRIVDALLTHDDRLRTAEFVLDVDPSEVHSEASRPGLPRWWSPSEHFVGRSPELGILRGHWNRCRNGDVLISLITGEPGIGKSALAVEAAERALVGGGVVLAGRCSPTSSLSFEPFSEAFGRLVDTLSETDIARLGDHAPRLGRLLPSAARRLGVAGVPQSQGHEVDRYLLFRAVNALIDQATEKAPMVLVIDDLQWADAGTLHMLDQVVRSDHGRRLMVIATVRTEDLDTDSTLDTFLGGWYRTGVVASVDLNGLSLEEVIKLLEADPDDEEAGADEASAPADLAQNLHDATGGNPFFVVEMVRHMRVSSTEPGTLPDSVQALVKSRLDRLTVDQRSTLRIAALQADRIDVDLISAVRGDRQSVVAAIDGAVASGLLIQRNGMFLFQHHLVRAVLESEIGPAQRAGLHRALGEALVARSNGDTTAVIDQIAGHFVHAATDGDAADAVHYAQLAGDAALNAFAYDTAAGHYAAGIDAAEHARPVAETAAIDLRLSLLEAWRLLGDYEEAAELCIEMMDVMHRVASLRQLRRFVWVCIPSSSAVPVDELDRFDRGLTRIEARFRCENGASEEDVALALLARAYSDSERGDATRAVERLDEVLEARTDDWDPDLAVRIVDAAVTVYAERRPIADRVALIDALFDRIIDDPESTIEQRQLTCSVARWAALTTGDIGRMSDLDVRMETHALRLGMPRYLAGMAQRRASLRLIRGRIDEAVCNANEAVQHRPDAEFFEGYAAEIAMARMHQGRAVEPLGALESIATNHDATWVAGRALLLGEAGKTEDARAQLKVFIEGLDDWDRGLSWLGALGLAVYAADVLHATDAVDPLVGLLTPHADRIALAGHSALILGPVELLLGMLSSLAGDVDATVRHLGAAEKSLNELEADVLRARSELAHAEVLVGKRADRHEEALGHADAALALLRSRGIQGRLRDRAEKLAS